jgi:hypothetical protein
MSATTSLGTAAAVIQPPADDLFRNLLAARIIKALTPLMNANNAREFRRIMKRVVTDYPPVKAWISVEIVAKAAESGKTTQGMVRATNVAFWEHLVAKAEALLSDKDRRVLLDVLWTSTELGALNDQVPDENREAWMSAFLDGYWALLELNVILSTVWLIAADELHPKNASVLHWLCLAAKRSIKGWHSAVFAHNPVLRERLRRPAKTISDEEMGRRLGLPA